ncbi:MAG: hypothetical protein IKU19_06210, partial [Clostridia bacterium]|nr:hypothetical protein [Clostridia bacterium]
DPAYGDEAKFFERVNSLTGVFCLFVVDGDKLSFLCDTVGLLSVFYSSYRGNSYVSTHVNLIGDILGLSEDPAVTKLKTRKTFKYFGNQLPGNITPFKEVKRLNPNHIAETGENQIEQRRFYHPFTLNLSVEEACDRLIPLMKKTMGQIADKWQRPAISLTGGCDSKTTLAAASDIYDRFKYFSYDSQANELPDAVAAQETCKALNLEHIFYKIPYEDEAFENIEGIRAVMLWNCGDVRYNNPNDVRKRAYLDKINDFDVEIKSWASEVGRARYTKRYNGRRNFGKKPSPRVCTTIYKFLLTHRSAVRYCDRQFKEYIDKYFESAPENPVPWQEQFYWEWQWSSLFGISLTSEHMFSDDITVPYNNRKVLELLLSVPEEDRINDSLYTLMRKRMDDRIDLAAETVVDVNHTDARAKRENLYYIVNRLLP